MKRHGQRPRPRKNAQQLRGRTPKPHSFSQKPHGPTKPNGKTSKPTTPPPERQTDEAAATYDSAERREALAKSLEHVADKEAVEARLTADRNQATSPPAAAVTSHKKALSARKTRTASGGREASAKGPLQVRESPKTGRHYQRAGRIEETLIRCLMIRHNGKIFHSGKRLEFTLNQPGDGGFDVFEGLQNPGQGADIVGMLGRPNQKSVQGRSHAPGRDEDFANRWKVSSVGSDGGEAIRIMCRH